MERIIIEGIYEVAELIYNNASKGKETTFVGLYEDVTDLVKELFVFDDVKIVRIDVEPEELDGYDKEYYVSLTSDMELWCCKAYDYDNEQYLFDETDILFVADDCNSKILEYVDYNKAFKVGYENEEPGCDGDCEHCHLGDPNGHEVVTRVATDDTGKLRGFEKSWSTNEDGLHYHTTYSFFSDNESMLKDMLENFSIKY